MITLIDTHAHLDHVEDVNTALKEAQSAGVSAILAVSTDLVSMQKNLLIQKTKTVSEHDRTLKIFIGLGVHPGEINLKELDSSYAFIREHIHEADVVGEIGLDFWYKWVRKDDGKKKEQREVFQKQLAIAKEFDKPVVVHSRGCWRECFETVKSFGIKKANFHWYSGPLDVLEDIVKNGYYISFGPALAYSPQSRAVIPAAPIENVLAETDSPVYFQDSNMEGGGFQAGPKDVFRALKAYVELKNLNQEETAKILNQNAMRFLKG